MGLWLKVHREVAGAWRSACYDMVRHLGRRRDVRLRLAETAEFAPRGHRGRHIARRPDHSRIAAVAGVALLVAGGAAGTYLAVAGTLAVLTAEPVEVPLAAPVAAAPTRGPVPSAIQPPPAQVTQQSRPQVRRSTPPTVLALPQIPVPVVVPTQAPTVPESTPTPSPSVSPSASPSESATPSPSVSDPSPSPSLTKRSKWGRSGDDRDSR